MFTKSILSVSFILFSLWLMNFSNIVYSQITLTIEFSGNESQVKETKKLLGKYDIYFVLSDNEELKSTYIKDNLLTIENITNEQIKNQKFPLVKFQNKKHCFYSLLSTDFFNSNVIRNLFIYRMRKEKRILGLFTITKKFKQLASKLSYTERGLSISHPITMIPCSDYNGEFDNGLENYRNHDP